MRILRFAQAAVAAAAVAFALPASVQAAGGGTEIASQDWSFSGVFGTIDRAAAQRGYQVYKEVCAGCHSMNLMHYRDLAGIGLPAETIKALASQADIATTNDDGDATTRPRRPSDPFPAPFANEKQARASNGGALPPDLSLMAKARENGPNYIYALLTGFHEPPPGFNVIEGMHYNVAFDGHQIAMAPPLFDDAVTYADGTKASLDQMAHDVSTFLMFTAEPHFDERKRMGLKVVLFLLVLSVMLYFVKKKVWADVH
ncbi:MAG: cytochrome c1 [Alphaproteobacteria bacterium]|nr:cytochrome c1 [Alphaproteobacteria bacterium]